MTKQELIEKLEARAAEEEKLGDEYQYGDYTTAHIGSFHDGKAEGFREALALISETFG